ncbi:hypothetical protein GCE9029_02308 [Grimontia celer]|uniref:DUF2059 domain-containing protein n=1 Tax=Grimontia celer TaxID=1796497 RepID=A0A128F2F0_9GAMM|nr:DUF2059 domain-containing protein [Grimontia celer]CZF80959.1 hypothetical protein GCE9029_02308 [Grimontia celer]
MFQQAVKWTLYLMMFCVAGFAQAASDKSLNALLKASGIEEMVNQFPDTVKAGILEAQQQQGALPEKDLDAMILSVDETIVPANILAGIRKSLSGELNDQQIAGLMTWYESPLGKSFTEAEAKSGTEEAFAAMSAEAPKLMQNQELIAQVQKIDQLLNATNLTVNFFEQVQMAIFAGLMSALQPDLPLDMSEMKKELNAVRQQSTANVQQMVHVSLAYAYKDFKPEEREQYIAFLSAPDASRFNQTALKSMMDQLEASFMGWAKSVGEKKRES